MIIVSGIGWISEKSYGCVREGLRGDYANLKSLYSRLRDESTIPYPIKNFGRFDIVSKMSCSVGALALRDAGISYSQNQKQDIGIIGTNNNGSLRSNLDYYKDYVTAGRTLARGNLFIYTLPSSPLAETAITFGLSGPLLYMTLSEGILPALLQLAGRMINTRETSRILALRADEKEAVSFLLAGKDESPSGKTWNLKDAVKRARKINRAEDIAVGFLGDSKSFCVDKL